MAFPNILIFPLCIGTKKSIIFLWAVFLQNLFRVRLLLISFDLFLWRRVETCVMQPAWSWRSRRLIQLIPHCFLDEKGVDLVVCGSVRGVWDKLCTLYIANCTLHIALSTWCREVVQSAWSGKKSWERKARGWLGRLHRWHLPCCGKWRS